MNVPKKNPATCLVIAGMLIGVSVGGACSSTSPLAPFEPEVANVQDSFSLQATGVKNVTATVTHTWANSGTRATINHSTTTTAGSAHLLVKDHLGAVVYDKDLEPSLNEPTTVGQPGDWTVEVVLTRYSGTLNMLAQKL